MRRCDGLAAPQCPVQRWVRGMADRGPVPLPLRQKTPAAPDQRLPWWRRLAGKQSASTRVVGGVPFHPPDISCKRPPSAYLGSPVSAKAFRRSRDAKARSRSGRAMSSPNRATRPSASGPLQRGQSTRRVALLTVRVRQIFPKVWNLAAASGNNRPQCGLFGGCPSTRLTLACTYPSRDGAGARQAKAVAVRAPGLSRRWPRADRARRCRPAGRHGDTFGPDCNAGNRRGARRSHRLRSANQRFGIWRRRAETIGLKRGFIRMIPPMILGRRIDYEK